MHADGFESESTDRRNPRMWQYLVVSLLGGFAGVVTTIVATVAEVDWDCSHRGRDCHDGQSGMIMMLTVPFMFVLGILASLIWTWITCRVPSNRLFASVFTYSGSRPWTNGILSLLLAVCLWIAIGYVIFRMMIPIL